jgi:hypothetical protein
MTRRQVEVLVAELAPQPDAPARIRRLPSRPPDAAPPPLAVPAAPIHSPAAETRLRPIVQPTSPERYRVQFTIGQATYDKLRRLQILLAREIPDRDPGAVFDRAVTLLLANVERAKLGRGAKPSGKAIRPGTDDSASRRRKKPKAAVRRAVSLRDSDQCAFVSDDGVRCMEEAFLDFHHRHAFALGGGETVGNIALYCWRHDQYERDRVFGPFRPDEAREPRSPRGDGERPSRNGGRRLEPPGPAAIVTAIR